MRIKSGALWQHGDFMKLWTGETVSLFGSQVSALALPLTAVVLLQATPAQMGIMNAVGFAPFLLVTLFAGVWLDRMRKRPVLVVSNLGRALLLALIPVMALAGALRMELLYGLVFLTGVLYILFELAYQAYLPSLLERDQLVEGNSKVFATAALAEIAGPGLAGWLVQLISAPFALIIDAASFLVAGGAALAIRKVELLPATPKQRQKLWHEIGSGLRLMMGNVYLRVFVGEAATYNFFNQAFITLFVLYATRDLHLSAGSIGLIYAVGSVGGLLGSLTAARLAGRIGIGRTITAGTTLSCFTPLLIPLASGPVIVPVMMLSYFLTGLGIALTLVHTFSIRQAIVPEPLRGRLMASYRFVSWGVNPFGAFFAGMLAQQIGAQATLLVAAGGLTLASLWFLFSPIPRLREMPAMIDETDADAQPVGVPALELASGD